MSDIISLQEFINKKRMADDLARGRTPLYVSHLTGKITGQPPGKAPEPDFGDRLARVRASIEKINRLMRELKELSDDKILHGPK